MLLKTLQKPRIIKKLYINRDRVRNINLFFVGLIIYISSLAIAATPNISQAVCQGFQLIGMSLFIYAAANLIKFRFESSYLKFVYLLYIFWLLTVVLRGISFNYDYIKQMLFDSEVGMFLYLVPVIILFPKNMLFYKRLFDSIFILNVIYIVYVVIFFKNFTNVDISDARSREILEVFSKNLSIPGGFFLLTYVYHSRRQKVVSFFVIFLTLFLAVLRARRGLVFMGLSTLSFSYIIYCYKKKAKAFHISLVTFLISLLLVLMFIGVDADKFGLFSSFADRIKDDSRTQVEICLFQEMSIQDWIIGKGMNGKYYCPGIDSIDTSYRSLIETGYLNIILKGGLVSLTLLLSIVVPAVIKGIFYSKNIMTKGAAAWILLWAIYSHPSTVTTFSFNYLLIWISVGICYSKAFRNMSDKSIKDLFWLIDKRRI